MTALSFIEMFGYSFTLIEMIAGGFAAMIFIAGAFKALHEIQTLGWQPFKEKWITPRATRKKAIDELLSEFAGFKETVSSMDSKIDGINRQFQTNGGGSLRDMVSSIDLKVEHLGARAKHQDETSSRAIFELDQQGYLEVVNCAFRELVDADEKELLHRDYISRVHPDDRTRFIRELQEAIDNKMPLDTTVRFRTSTSNFVAVRLRANPYVRSGGELRRFFGTAESVT